jgi:phage-related protein
MSMNRLLRPARPLRWIGSSSKDLKGFPKQVRAAFGFGLHLAQTGQHPPKAKPLKGFGSGALELLEDFDGDTYRAAYVVRFERAVYVLHIFKKKSKRGSATPQPDIELIKRRLRDAESDNAERMKKVEKP